jgi:heme/copper-type cytochrome/quinol oxidase subunit 3
MAETTPSAPAGLTRGQEEAAFYHEAALNSAWTGVRLMIGIVTSGLGAFVFAFFYLRSVNNYGLWYPKGFAGPQAWEGAVIVIAIVVSAVAQSLGLQRLKAGKKSAWLTMGAAALGLGVIAVVFMILQLATLPFQPGDNAFASVFVGASVVFTVLVLAIVVWLEILLMSGRQIPEISFVEQPPTFAEATAVQRFQASLSAFTLFWNFLAIAAVVLWVLFYLVH